MRNLRSVITSSIVLILMVFMTQTTVAGTESLVLYMPLDEGSGDTTKDLSGNGNDGTIKNGKWIDGKINKALEFTGNGYIDIKHSASLSLEKDITIMAWIFMNKSAGGELAIVSKGQWAANDLPYELTVTPGGTIYWQFYDDAGRDSCSPPSPPVAEWHHIAATYDGKTFVCYVDGALGEKFDYAGKLPQNTANVTIGKRSKAEEGYFNGAIDEVAIFSSALNEEDIKSSMEGIKLAAVDAKGKLPMLWGTIKSK